MTVPRFASTSLLLYPETECGAHVAEPMPKPNGRRVGRKGTRFARLSSQDADASTPSTRSYLAWKTRSVEQDEDEEEDEEDEERNGEPAAEEPTPNEKHEEPAAKESAPSIPTIVYGWRQMATDSCLALLLGSLVTALSLLAIYAIPEQHASNSTLPALPPASPSYSWSPPKPPRPPPSCHRA